MRLIYGELYKLFSKKLFLICLVGFLLANSFVLYYTNQNDIDTGFLIENKSKYEQLITTLSYMSRQDADNYISKELKMRQKKLRNSENKDDVFSEIMLLQNLKNQLIYIDGYKSFLGEMQSRADEQKSFSIFAKKGSFSYNNLEQTPKDFEHLKDIKLKIGNNSAVEKATAFTLTDLLMFALVFLMCVFLFTVERDKGLYGLVRSTENGRLNVIVAKLGVLLGLTVLFGCIYYSSDYITCGLQYGFGELSRSVQSISTFENCSLKLNIWQSLLLWLGGKLLAMLSLAALLALVFVLIKNTGVIFIVSAVGLIVEFILNSVIDPASSLNHLKYINYFYILKGNNFFGNYLNLDFFSYPININIVFVVVSVLLIISSFVICVTTFTKRNQSSKNSMLMSAVSKLLGRFSGIRGSVRLLSGESYKHYRTSLVGILLIALVFIGYNNLTKDINIVYQSAEESAYSEYMNTLSGEINAEKEKFIKTEQKYYNGLNEQLDNITFDNSLSVDEKNAKSEHIHNILETKGAAFEKVLEQRDYIKSVGKEYSLKPIYINNLFYKRLLENSQREWEYFALLLMVVVFSVSNIFACEHKKGMANLIRCTRNGKLRIVISKCIVVVITLSISFAVIYLPFLFNFINTFGADSMNSPIIFMQGFSGINSTMTITQNLILTGVTHYITALAFAMLGIMLSQLLRNNILTIIVAAVIGLFPCLMCMNIETMRLFTAFQNGIWQWLVPVILTTAVAISVACFVTTEISFSKVRLRR